MSMVTPRTQHLSKAKLSQKNSENSKSPMEAINKVLFPIVQQQCSSELYDQIEHFADRL